jgi:hypothetical protein
MADEVFHYPQGAVDAFTRQLNDDIAGAIKFLLEEKHLYQKVTVDPDAIAAKMMLRVHEKDRQWTSEHIHGVMNQRLTLTSGVPLLAAPRGQEPQLLPALVLRNVRLFCQTCKERQTFKPVWYQDAANDLLRRAAHGEAEINFDPARVQLFFIAYQCEHCHGTPEGFLIRREGWRFSLDGRSPMEHIQLPAHIPKKEGNLFRDALIAQFAGKQLAAVFYLRTFIEQFARRQTEMKGRETGDEIMEAYSGTLPNAQRDQMPSLREWYGKLSAPIHTADEVAAENLFDQARQEIERHFEIRRVFKIPEK